MKKPTEILLGAFNWGVEFGEISIEDAEELDSTPENLLGFTDRKSLQMYIDGSLTPQMLRVTFLHELVHAMSDTFGLGFDDVEREDIVNQIASAMFNFMKQNPKAVEWLMKEE